MGPRGENSPLRSTPQVQWEGSPGLASIVSRPAAVLHTNAGAVLLCCQVVHSTVQLTYALIFGTFGPMLQSVFNLAVLYQREFQLCQSVLCTIAGALTVRNFDRNLGNFDGDFAIFWHI